MILVSLTGISIFNEEITMRTGGFLGADCMGAGSKNFLSTDTGSFANEVERISPVV